MDGATFGPGFPPLSSAPATGLTAIAQGYFSFNPLLRGALLSALTFLGIELAKPAFAYTQIGSTFYARPFGSGNDGAAADNPSEIIPGTNLPWFALPAAVFIFFGLIV